jgi:hypothetical protein
MAVNYFAHASVAARLGAGDARVLGAMLPDFARMLGARLGELSDPELAQGSALHHRTDAAFHVSPTFRALEREGVRELLAAGVRRGPARGAAHVGLELLLDASLAGGEHDGRYLAALGTAPALADAIAWRPAQGASRWRRLHARLRAAGPPSRRPAPERVAERIARALAPRPRLRLEADEPARVTRWLAAAAPTVERRAAEMLDETLVRLELR